MYGEVTRVVFFLSFFAFGGLAIKVILVKEILETLNVCYNDFKSSFRFVLFVIIVNIYI